MKADKVPGACGMGPKRGNGAPPPKKTGRTRLSGGYKITDVAFTCGPHPPRRLPCGIGGGRWCARHAMGASDGRQRLARDFIGANDGANALEGE
jgi:hypothetical protein